MADWLLLRLPRDTEQPVSWVIVDAHGQLLSPAVPALGDELRTAAVGRRVALLVPGTEVSLLTATLPAGNEQKLLQLAPYALEDQVSQDVDDLHFAVGARNAADGSTPVAVVERSSLDAWMARLQELSLQPQAIFADIELAPQLPGHVCAVLDGDQLIVRNDSGRPLVLSAEDPALALEMLLGDSDWRTVHMVLHASPQDWHRRAATMEALRSHLASLRVQLSSGGTLALLAQGLPASNAINLLQGTYRTREDSAVHWKRWRLVAALAAGLLVFHVGGLLWQRHRLDTAERQLDASIGAVYASVFGGQPAGADARRRIEQRMTALAGSGNQHGELMHLLAAISAASQNVPVAKIQALDFKPGLMEMKLTAPDASTLEQFNKSLRGSGYSAQITSGSMRGANYEGRIELKSAGS
jgi:general secretion pathway protein L